MKQSYSIVSAMALIGVLGVTSAANAQSGEDFFAREKYKEDFFVRDKYRAVTDRSQPEFDPIKIRSGAFEISPEVRFRSGFTDNLFANEQNEVDDVFVGVAPSINFASTWSRNSFNFGGTIDHVEYSDVDSESRTNLMLRSSGGLDVTSDFNLYANALFDDMTEPRSNVASLQNAAEPVEFTRAGGEVGAAYQAGRIRINSGIAIVTADFDDVELESGLIQDQDFRDNDSVSANLRAAYAVQRDWAVFAEVNHSETEYDPPSVFNTTIRDFSDTSVRVGLDFELQALLRGDIGVGVFQSEFDEPTFSDVDGVSVDATMQWFVTQLTTMSFGAGRQTIDPGLVETSGAVRSNVSARADHELRRNIIISGEARFTNFEFENIDRTDDRWNLRASATWKMNRNLWLDGSYQLTDQSSNVQDFTENRLLFGLRIFP